MDLTHTFTVPLGVEETWGHFNDIGSLAGTETMLAPAAMNSSM